jgi:hypothetical protein
MKIEATIVCKYAGNCPTEKCDKCPNLNQMRAKVWNELQAEINQNRDENKC